MVRGQRLTSQGNLMFDVSALDKGVYLVKLLSGSESFSKKLVIAR
ncbi:MAG: T9SS type A sorting domain-containing protein [Flavobacteriales bacterium]|nr:T9SS type A sorting domain-containing protein [Flavobacteriales bacterium]